MKDPGAIFALSCLTAFGLFAWIKEGEFNVFSGSMFGIALILFIVKNLVSSLFIFIAAILNAVMDILENENFYVSRFKNLNPKFWYKRESWKHAYKIFGYKIDGWHLAKSSMIVCLCLAIVFYVPILGIIDFVLFGCVWNLTFNISYSALKL